MCGGNLHYSRTLAGFGQDCCQHGLSVGVSFVAKAGYVTTVIVIAYPAFEREDCPRGGVNYGFVELLGVDGSIADARQRN
jgi:hypothetical protein